MSDENNENTGTNGENGEGAPGGGNGESGGQNGGETNIRNIENIETVQIAPRGFTSYFQYLPHVLIGLIGLIVAFVFFFMFASGKSSVYVSGDTLATRGLITFLVAFVTIMIAIILTLSVVLGNAADFKERFALGKEILTILIGVLGTIIGFYFGAEKAPATAATPPAAVAGQFQVIPLGLSSEEVTSTVSTVITAGVSGGKPPYKYTIEFDSALLEAITGDAKEGVIQAEVRKPATGFESDTAVAYSIEVTDAENRKVVLTRDKTKGFVVKNQ